MVIVYHHRHSHLSSTNTLRLSLFEMLTKTAAASSLHQMPATPSPVPLVPPGFPPHSPLRRTSRKRSAPHFCSCHPAGQQHPPATTRRARRGRPPKSTSVSACQEIEVGNGNTVSPNPTSEPSISTKQKSLHKDNQFRKQSCQGEPSPPHDQAGKTTTVMGATNDVSIHCVEETNQKSDVSLIEPLGLVCGGKSVRNVLLDYQTSQDVHSKILPDVGNDLHSMTGSQISQDQTERNSRSCDINEHFLSTLKSIYSKHGDISQNCWLKSGSVKSCVLSRVCEVVQDLQMKRVKDLAMDSLDSYYAPIMDAENMNMNVSWLLKRLDEIKDAIKLSEVKGLVDDKRRLIENIDEKKKLVSQLDNEIERLKSERQGIVDQVAQDAARVEELNKKINARTSKCAEFPHEYLMDGLI